MLDFAVIFFTGLGIMFRFYYAYLSVPFVDVRWLETHLWAAILSVPLILWHVIRYFNVSFRIAAPKPGESPTGGAAASASRRRVLFLTAGSAAGLSFAFSFWPFQWLRFVNGPAWEDGFPVERILGMADDIDLDSWRLRVTGDVANPLEIAYEQLLEMARKSEEMRLSCVTGWTTVQTWTGVPVAEVLDLAGANPGYQSVEFKGASGYSYQWWREELGPQALVVTAVGGKILSSGHGFPARLMAPNRPGQNNVKQLVEIRVSVEPPKLRNADLRIRG
jgi:DMSO/TMAO reductase YedYZ molybdopterin-dependent catalytic subunit